MEDKKTPPGKGKGKKGKGPIFWFFVVFLMCMVITLTLLVVSRVVTPLLSPSIGMLIKFPLDTLAGISGLTTAIFGVITVAKIPIVKKILGYASEGLINDNIFKANAFTALDGKVDKIIAAQEEHEKKELEQDKKIEEHGKIIIEHDNAIKTLEKELKKTKRIVDNLAETPEAAKLFREEIIKAGQQLNTISDTMGKLLDAALQSKGGDK